MPTIPTRETPRDWDFEHVQGPWVWHPRALTRHFRLVQRVDERSTLAVAETGRAPVRVDAGLLEQRGDLDGAQARHCLEQRGDLGLADGLVFLRLAEHRRDGPLAGLDRRQELGAGLARLRGLGKRLSALLWSQRGQSHRGVPS